MLSATPYNKSYLDLSAQLRLFIGEEDVLRIRPEQYLKTIGEAQFQQQFQAHPRSIVAFEKSEYTDDWRDLMRLYLVRRTRSFIENNYAETDPLTGRRFMELGNGERFYFPRRVPKTVPLQASPQYQRLYSDQVVELVNDLSLPRYGLGQYVDDKEADKATAGEKQQIENLSRAGKRLMGFCRTNLFKRLESSGKVISAIGGPPHPAQSCLSPCHRERPGIAHRLAGRPYPRSRYPGRRQRFRILSPCTWTMIECRRQRGRRRYCRELCPACASSGLQLV